MAACAMLTYNNVTPESWQSIQKVVAKYGVTIAGNSGSATTSDFTVAWNYGGPSGALSIQCTDYPWYAGCSTINAKINDAVEACLNQHDIEITHMVRA